MPDIVSTSKITFDHMTPQSELKEFAMNVFGKNFKDMDRLITSFDNALIETRNLSVPISYFAENKSFSEKNKKYIEYALKYSVSAINDSLIKSGIYKDDITDIIFVSTTGLSTPSIDALIINKMKLNENIKRWPIWGLGCAGGTAGIAKANVIAKADPDAVVMLVALELCSLTFVMNDMSKSNFIATGLFSDGAAAVLITGDNFENKSKDDVSVRIIDSQSRIYYDSLDIMGWDFPDEGFRVIFSRDIPTVVRENVRKDVDAFLKKNGLNISDIKNFVTHPGGTKVINAYMEALNVEPAKFNNTFETLKDYGNMSSATVLYVLDRFFEKGFERGHGLMISLGPGFSLELVLLEIK
ncbi:MAG: 3-oxoacyl-[acyl-carrier-protein] synthase III C-terminal domain-containing protein [bacterium]